MRGTANPLAAPLLKRTIIILSLLQPLVKFYRWFSHIYFYSINSIYISFLDMLEKMDRVKNSILADKLKSLSKEVIDSTLDKETHSINFFAIILIAFPALKSLERNS